MKKMLFLFILALLVIPIKVNARPTSTTGTIKVIWGDYDNKMGERPDSFDIELLDLISDERVNVTVDVNDGIVTRVNGQTTTWEVPVELPMFDIEASYQFTNTDDFVTGYIFNSDASGGRISEDGGTITLVFFKDINKLINYTFHFNDDDHRDFTRFDNFTWITMKATNSTEEYILKCNYVYDNSNTCEGDAYIHAYYADEDKRPIWDDPINYEFFMTFSYPDLDFSIVPDLDNNKVDGYLTYSAMKIDDVPIKINFLNGHEYELEINLLNQRKEIERSLKSKEDIIVKDLFLNMPTAKEIIYKVDVVKEENYTYDISGNKDDGFVINVTYIEPIIPSGEIENPNTLDSIFMWITLEVLSVVGIINILNIKRKIN